MTTRKKAGVRGFLTLCAYVRRVLYRDLCPKMLQPLAL